MDKMKDLKDLLRHEVLDLCSAEDQIIEGMPAMIEKATHPNLKKALREHLRVTENQRKRLDQVTAMLGEDQRDLPAGKVGSFFFGLFQGGEHKCKAMEGIIAEGNKMMAEDMNEEVMDAAIISSSQKIEHYEICGYGTAKAFARELQLGEVAALLDETLNEEYQADNILTALAVRGGINEEAEQAGDEGEGNNTGKSTGKAGAKAASGKANKKASAGGGQSSSGGGSKGVSAKASSLRRSAGQVSKSGSSKGASAKAGSTKTATVSSGGSKKSAAGSSSSASGRKTTSGSRSAKGAASSSKANSGNSRGGKSPGNVSGSNKKGAATKKSAATGKKAAGTKAGSARRR